MRSFFDTLALIVGKGTFVAIFFGFAVALWMTAHIKPASSAVIATGIGLSILLVIFLIVVVERKYRIYMKGYMEYVKENRERDIFVGYLTLIIFGISILACCLVWLAQGSIGG